MAKKVTRSEQRKGSRPIGASGAAGGSNRRILWIAGGLAVGLLAILALVAILNNPNNSEPPATIAAGDSTFAQRYGQPVDRSTIGDANAPVKIVAYEDFQCPHCQDFNAEMEDAIMQQLVAPGIASFEFAHRIVIGPDSVRAAAAAECAADQNRFWEYHDALFASLRSNPSAVSTTAFKRVAADVGLDSAAFDSCIDSDQHLETVLREDNEARNAGVNATPTIFINGERYQGPLLPDVFVETVKSAAGES